MKTLTSPTLSNDNLIPSTLPNDTLINIPPPVYHHKDPRYNDIIPPPRYSTLISQDKIKEEDDDDSWSKMMKKPFYIRWKYILSSWIPVLEQGKWVFCNCLSFFILVFVILIMIVLGVFPHFRH